MDYPMPTFTIPPMCQPPTHNDVCRFGDKCHFYGTYTGCRTYNQAMSVYMSQMHMSMFFVPHMYYPDYSPIEEQDAPTTDIVKKTVSVLHQESSKLLDHDMLVIARPKIQIPPLAIDLLHEPSEIHDGVTPNVTTTIIPTEVLSSDGYDSKLDEEDEDVETRDAIAQGIQCEMCGTGEGDFKNFWPGRSNVAKEENHVAREVYVCGDCFNCKHGIPKKFVIGTGGKLKSFYVKCDDCATTRSRTFAITPSKHQTDAPESIEFFGVVPQCSHHKPLKLFLTKVEAKWVDRGTFKPVDGYGIGASAYSQLCDMCKSADTRARYQAKTHKPSSPANKTGRKFYGRGGK